MSNLTFSELPKPTNWEHFERCCCKLFKCILEDPNAHMHGRGGQAQHGVDVYGYRKRDIENLVGVQCKKKYEKAVTEKELIDELEKAKKFEPRIKEFFLLTTAARDTKIQEVARKLTLELSKSDHPIEVIVWGWEDIHENAADHSSAWLAFDPTSNPIALQTHERVIRLENKIDSIKGVGVNREDGIINIDTIQNDETELHGKIKGLATFITEGEPSLALKNLQKLKEESWENANKSERFRLLITMASAEHQIGSDVKASELLQKAALEYPSHEDAEISKSKSYFLQHEFQKSLDIALSLLNNEKHGAEAASLVIQCRMHIDQSIEVLEGISEEVQDTPIVLTALIFRKRYLDDSSWTTDSVNAKEKHPEDRNLRQYAAEAALEKFLKNREGNTLGSPLTKVEKIDLQEASQILKKEFNIADKAMNKVPEFLVNNTALILRILERNDEAKTILDRGLKDFPENNHLIIQRACIMREEGKFEDILKILPETLNNLEITLLRAEVMSASKDTAEDVLNQIEEINLSSLNQNDQHYALAIKVRAYVTLNEHEAAEDLINKFLALKPMDPRLHAIKIKIYRCSNQIEKAKKYLDQIIDDINIDEPQDSIYELAQEAKVLNRSDISFSLLKDKVSPEILSDQLLTLIAAAIEQKQTSFASQLFKDLDPEILEEPEIIRLKIIFGISVGEPNLETDITKYLKIQPTDLEMFIQYLFILQRQNRTFDIQRRLKNIEANGFVGTPEHMMDLASFFIRSNLPIEGFSLAYKILVKNWHHEKVHQYYQAMMLANDEISKFLPSESTVEENMVVTLESNHDETRRLCIENIETSLWGLDHIYPTDDLAIALIGKSVGDEIQFDNDRETVWEIKEVNHLWIEALQKSLQNFNSRFPKSNGLKKLTYEIDSEKPLKEFEEIIKEDYERVQKLIDLYQEKLIPFSFLSALIGKDPIDAWANLLHSGQKFRVCIGLKEERETAKKLILERERKGCVVDVITLTLIYRLKLFNPITKVCGQIYTPQSVIDLFINRKIEAEHYLEKTMGTLSYVDGEMRTRAYTYDERKAILDDRIQELNSINKNCRIKEAIPKDDLSFTEISALKRYNAHVSQPAITAQGARLLLLSEDMGYRVWARNTLNVSSCWLLPILTIAYEEGHIQKEQYFDAVVNLVDCGHSYISLSTDIILYQLEKDNFQLTHKSTTTLQMIGGATADISTNLPIAVSIIKYLLNQKIDKFLVLRIASVLFETMTEGRKNVQREIVKSMVEPLKPFHKFLQQHAISWLVGHSIGESYFDELLELQKKVK
ncbi:MAG: hypothetical protein ABJN57_09425 [Hyphomicrobiales bacterium]